MAYKKNHIPLKTLIPHGKIATTFYDDGLELSSQVKVGDFLDPRVPCLILPKRYKLPFRVDLRLKIDADGLHLLVGKGHIPFTCGWNGRAIIDIIEGIPKKWTKMKTFDATFELNRYTDISIIYDFKFMMIKIDGEIRYFSTREKYMKSPLLQETNEEGLEIKITTEKFSTASVKSLAVTEYSDDEITVLRDELNQKEELQLDIPAGVDKGKESFEECIALLPEAVQQEIIQTNEHLLSMKKLKIRRSIEGTHKGCRIKYNSSEFGFGYHIIASKGWASHFFWFSMHFNHKYGDFGARKCDHTEAMLNKIAETSPAQAAKIFDYYGECGICVYASRGSKCPTVYEHNNVKKTTCHGQMKMNMKPETFQDVRIVFDALYEILLEKK